jgi:preprotein translocase subunit SecE
MRIKSRDDTEQKTGKEIFIVLYIIIIIIIFIIIVNLLEDHE